MTVGFVGLGNMGSVLAGNLVTSGLDVLAHDVAGARSCPEGATFVDDLATIARSADVVVLSLPDGDASAGVAAELVAAEPRAVTHVVDTSTIGVDAARGIDALLAQRSIRYVDAPVSGGIDGARARTLMVMYAAGDDECAAVEDVLAGMSDRRRRVGERPGMAQALKLLNNFLSATALAATSEALAFGRSVGLDLATMLDVLNSSSGRSSATEDKFPNHVLTGTYGSGFANTLMAKDLRLYGRSVDARGTASNLGRATTEIWRRFAEAEPGEDFTRIYPFVEASAARDPERPPS